MKRALEKPAETTEHGTRCASCGAIRVSGKWVSPDRATKAHSGPLRVGVSKFPCPACQQARRRIALGVVEIHGDSWRRQSDQIFRIIGDTEKAERKRNDQERILWLRSLATVTRIYVSLPELARNIGRGLFKNFRGRLEYHRSKTEPRIRVVWDSDAEGAPSS